LAWLKRERPDVVSLQELKAEQRAFPIEAIRSLGYEAVWEGERSRNGVAILARNQTPVLPRSSLPGDLQDQQARYIEAAVQGILITSIYLPNGNPQPGPKFKYKLAWFKRRLDGCTSPLTPNPQHSTIVSVLHEAEFQSLGTKFVSYSGE
jgi:exodeoxyribonuclease III